MAAVFCVILLFFNGIVSNPPFIQSETDSDSSSDINDCNKNAKPKDKIKNSTSLPELPEFPEGVLNETRVDELIKEALKYDTGEIFEFSPEIYNYSTTQQPRVPYAAEGVFFNFTVDLFETVTNKIHPGRISEYFRILGSQLRVSSSRRRSCGSFLRHFMKRLGKKAKLLSRNGVAKIKSKVNGLLNDVLEPKPKRVAFLKAMNSLFNLRYSLKLDAYIYYLRGYGKRRENARVIKKQTGILIGVLLHLIYKQEDDVIDDVMMKLKSAYEEYYS